MRPAGSRASPCDDSGNRSGGLGAAPPVIRFGGAVASPRRNKPLPKKAPAPPARGAFFPSHGSAKRPFRGTRSVSTGASIRPRSRGFRAASLPPAGGRRRRRRGGHLHPLRGVPGQPRPGTGEGGAASGPIVAQMGNNRRSRRPRLRLDKTLIFESECIVNYFI